MPKQIIIDIGRDGKATIEAEGYQGATCEAATKPFEDVLGGGGNRDYKPEYIDSVEQSEGRAQQ